MAVIVAAIYLWQKERPALYLWTALFAASVISLVVLYRHSVYHYHPAMTLFILLSAVGWVRIADIIAWGFSKNLKVTRNLAVPHPNPPPAGGGSKNLNLLLVTREGKNLILLPPPAGTRGAKVATLGARLGPGWGR